MVTVASATSFVMHHHPSRRHHCKSPVCNGPSSHCVNVSMLCGGGGIVGDVVSVVREDVVRDDVAEMRSVTSRQHLWSW